MKIKYFSHLLLVVMLMLSFSCEEALDMAPDGKLTMDEIFSDNDKVGAFLNSCYNYIPRKGTRYFFWSRGPVVWSDEAWDTDAEAEPWIKSGRMYNGDVSAGNHVVLQHANDGNGDYWNRYWAAIRNCSLFLERIDEATVKNEADRNRWRAEAHLLRAFYYSKLLKWFGPQLVIERTPFGLEDDFSTLEKASYYDVVQFIMEDCDAALGISELPWRITTEAEAGRVNKAMALAIKSEMILFAASPLNNAGSDHWEEAYNVNKQAVNTLKANGYELYNEVNFPQTYLSDRAYFGPGEENNEYAALYNEYFTNEMNYSSSPVDKETIYQDWHGQGNIWHIDGIGAQAGYKSGTCPSQELVDSYETHDGEPVLDLANPYLDEQHMEPNYNPDNTLYDPQDPYLTRNPRFYASIYYNGSKRYTHWGFSEVPESPENYPGDMGERTRIIATYVGEPQTGISNSVRKRTRTGYYERKFLHPNAGATNAVQGAPHKFYRLGEVILNFAEAAAEYGALDEARAAVNEIRARVGMPPISASLSQEEMILRVRHERRVELAMEENRYYDVRRWTQPDGDLSDTDKWITAMEIIRNGEDSYTYGRRPVRETPRACYTNKFLWLPVPLNEANRLSSITGQNWQNPGW